MFVRFLLLSVLSASTALSIPSSKALHHAFAFDEFNILASDPRPSRALRQTESGPCQWDSTVSRCAISDEATAALLKEGDSSYGELMLRFTECRIEGSNPQTCAALDDCGWSEANDNCAFVDYTHEYPTSPCVAPVAKTLESAALSSKCPTFDSTDCSAKEGCAWDESSGICNLDMLMIYVGIEGAAFDSEVTTVFNTELDTLTDLFISEFDFEFLYPEWSMALEWEIPETGCPEGSDPLVCEYVDTYLSITLPERFYCTSKYGLFAESECTADDLCEVDRDSLLCVEHYSITRQSWNEADKILLELISEPGDREIFQALHSCVRIRSEEECTGNCQWGGTDEICLMDPLFVRDVILSQADSDPGDPVCLRLSLPLEYDCLERTTEASCHGNEGCEWNVVAQVCVVGRQTNTALVREEDEDLAEDLVQQDLACSEHTTAIDCATA